MTAPAQQVAAGGGLSAVQIATLISLIEAQSKVREQLTQTAVNAATAAFATLSPADWWDAGKVDKAISDALRVLQPSQRQVARITDAYLSRAVSTMTGRRSPPAGAVDITKLRRAIPAQVARDLAAGQLHPAYLVLGEHDPDNRRVIQADGIDDPIHLVIPDPNETPTQRIRRLRAQQGAASARAVNPGEPYGRVADSFRYQVIADGSSEEEAAKKAMVRIAAVAATDMTLAVREQVRKSLGPITGIRGYRRILRPELTKSGPCGLCVVAADRIYHKEDLQPIHDKCVCEVLPIIGSLDPGLRLNNSDLEAIYDAAGNTGGDVIKGGRRHSGALKKIRVALVEHGELGPVLTNADQKFRGPVQVAKTQVPDRATRVRAQLDALEESFARLTRRALAGEDVDRPLKWQTDRIAALEHELASIG